MNHCTLLAALSCLVVTSCTTTKEATEPQQSVTPEVQVVKTTPVTAELSDELLIIIKKSKADISIQDQSMSPEGNVILTVNGNSYFSEGATITINATRLDDLSLVVHQAQSIMQSSLEQSRKVESMVFGDDSWVPVRYEGKPNPKE